MRSRMLATRVHAGSYSLNTSTLTSYKHTHARTRTQATHLDVWGGTTRKIVVRLSAVAQFVCNYTQLYGRRYVCVRWLM